MSLFNFGDKPKVLSMSTQCDRRKLLITLILWVTALDRVTVAVADGDDNYDNLTVIDLLTK